jgi:hypothetical protein
VNSTTAIVIAATHSIAPTENSTHLGTFFGRVTNAPTLPQGLASPGFALAAVPTHRYDNEYENEEYNGACDYPTSTFGEAIHLLTLARRPSASVPAPLLRPLLIRCADTQ